MNHLIKKGTIYSIALFMLLSMLPMNVYAVNSQVINDEIQEKNEVSRKEIVNLEESNEPVTIAEEPTEAAIALAKSLANDNNGELGYDSTKVNVDGNTVKLLDDITLSSTASINSAGPVILDLNSHTITKTKASVITIPKECDLTITDSSDNPGNIVSGTGTMSGTVTLTGTGKLTVEKVTIQNTASGSSAYAIYGATTSTLIINSGTIKGTFSSGIYNNTSGNNCIHNVVIESDIQSIIEKYIGLADEDSNVVLTTTSGSNNGTITSGTLTRFEVTDSKPTNYIAYREVNGHQTYLTNGDLSVLLNGLNGTNTSTIYVTQNAEIYKSFNAISTLKPENTLTFDIASGVEVTGALSFDGPAVINWNGGNFNVDISARNSTNKGYVVDESEKENGRISIRVENAVARIGNNYFGSLANAVKTVGRSETATIVMLADEELSESVVLNTAQNITLDLNGHNISIKGIKGVPGDALTVYGNTNLTITGKGTIESVDGDVTIRIGASTPKTTVTIDKDVIIKGNTGVLVQPLSASSDSANASAEVVVKGQLISENSGGCGLNIQGQLVNGKAIISIEEGALIKGASNGIYAAGNSDITMNGGTVEGATGIEIRAGKLTVNDGTITATAESFSVNANGSGGTTVGAGIAVAQHETKLPIQVIVNGGTVSGYVGLNIADPQNKDDSENIDIQVKDGDFIATGDGEDSVSVKVEKDYDVSKFVEGGNFSDSLLETGYLDDSLQAELHSTRKNEDAPFSYHPSMTEALQEAQDGDTVTHIESMEDTDRPVPITFNSGYDEISIVVYVEVSDTYVLPENVYFNYKGHTFSGWKIGDTDTIEVSGTTINLPKEGITLTAQWDIVDKTELEKTINQVKELNEDEYTSDSWKALEEALTTAEEIFAKTNTTQEEVDNATTALKDAINNLVKVTVDKTVLEQTINSTNDLNEKDYTAESWNALQKVLDQAKIVLADEDATQEEVDAMVKELQDAITNLVEKEDDIEGGQIPTENPKKPNNNEENPKKVKTGDNNLIWTWTSLMSISIVGLFILGKKRRMNKL